jgi:hypothetical protein
MNYQDLLRSKVAVRSFNKVDYSHLETKRLRYNFKWGLKILQVFFYALESTKSLLFMHFFFLSYNTSVCILKFPPQSSHGIHLLSATWSSCARETTTTSATAITSSKFKLL